MIIGHVVMEGRRMGGFSKSPIADLGNNYIGGDFLLFVGVETVRHKTSEALAPYLAGRAIVRSGPA
jgi:hypothetical protein